MEARVLKPYEGLEVPQAIAARRARGMIAFMCDPDGKWRQEVHAAVGDDAPFTPASATALIRETLARPWLSMGDQREAAFLLEALVGPDAVLEAIAESFAATTDVGLCEHAPGKVAWAWAAGYILLRASREVGERTVARLEDVVARAMRGAPEQGSVAAALDHALHGHRASARSGPTRFGHLPLWSEATTGELAGALAQVPLSRWAFEVEPRLVLVGGDPVIDFYRQRWQLLSEPSRQRQLVERFGIFRSPAVRALMEELAEKSKAKRFARAWLDAHPITGATMSPSPAPSPSPAAVRGTIDPSAILAAFDEAVRQNDWPDFYELNIEDGFLGLRLVAARAVEGWGVVLERFSGSSAEDLEIRRWRFGSLVPPGRDLDGDVPVSLDPAYLAKHPGACWPDRAQTLQRVGLPANVAPLVVSDAFEHVALAADPSEQALPSTSPVYVSLARTLVQNDGSLFVPGTPNTRAERPTARRPKRRRRSAPR
jgi:hypothetical protein